MKSELPSNFTDEDLITICSRYLRILDMSPETLKGYAELFQGALPDSLKEAANETVETIKQRSDELDPEEVIPPSLAMYTARSFWQFLKKVNEQKHN